VINADDYYGPESYQTLFDFLTTQREKEEYAVVGYKINNTLSEHGTVNRGVCQTDPEGYLVGIEECTKIAREPGGIISFPTPEGGTRTILPDTLVSMNMWGFYPSYFHYFEQEFGNFLQAKGQDLKSEYYLPTLIDTLIITQERQTKILSCDAEWFGVTYREDKAYVSERLNGLIEKGVYKKNLWG
jgi:hypothetical protein